MSERQTFPDFLDAQPTKSAEFFEKIEILPRLVIFLKITKNHEAGKDFDFFANFCRFCGLGIEKIRRLLPFIHFLFDNRSMIDFQKGNALETSKLAAFSPISYLETAH